MIVEAVRDWLRGFEPLSDDRLTIDYQPDRLGDHAIYNTTTNAEVRQYLSGTDKQFDFVVASCEAYGDQIAGNIENLQFFEELREWVKQQNRRPKNLPKLSGNRVAQRVRVVSPGYLMQTSEDGRARYQMQLKLLYHERKSFS